MGTSALTVLSVLIVLVGEAQAPPSDRLYGRVLTTDGQSVEGYLRWNDGEVSTTDYLDGGRVTPPEFLADAVALDPDFAARQKAERSIVAFGQRISWDEDDIEGAPLSESAIRFGHIRTLEPVDDRSARLTLTDGVMVEMRSLSSDIGRRMQPLAIETRDGDIVRVRWRELTRVDFLSAPTATRRPAATRIHGTLTTTGGAAFTGNIRWDLDETVDTDILDGRGQGGEPDREIPFSEIARIEWESARSARVTLRDGSSVELRGTNDVNREIRGIEVFDPGLGRVIVYWEDFQSVRFHDAGIGGAVARAAGALAEATGAVAGATGAEAEGAAVLGTGADRSEPGGVIRGVVHARDGRVIEGEVRWDNDESQWWEMLDGWNQDTEYAIEFGAIATITRLSEEAVAVTLLDGRTVALEGKSDVDDRNRGIFVKPEGRPRRLVRWADFERLELVR